MGEFSHAHVDNEIEQQKEEYEHEIMTLSILAKQVEKESELLELRKNELLNEAAMAEAMDR